MGTLITLRAMAFGMYYSVDGAFHRLMHWRSEIAVGPEDHAGSHLESLALNFHVIVGSSAVA